MQSDGGKMKAHNADQAGGLESRQKLSFLYLFAGVERKADISCYLHALAARSMAWDCHEVNILSTSDHDLLDQDLQQELLEQVSAGRFSALMVSPPYNTWSRAVWANTLGPRPIRNSLHPLEFPWLSHSNKVKADNANMLVSFAVAVLEAAARARDRGHNVVAMLEHPEDLGQAHRGHPASIWQLPQVRSLRRLGFKSVALFQCSFGTDYSEPTRLLSNATNAKSLGWEGWPVKDFRWKYLGPLPIQCGHRHLHRLVRRPGDTSLATSPIAAYPKHLNGIIAHGLHRRASSRPCGGVFMAGRSVGTLYLSPRCLTPWDENWTYIGRGCSTRSLLRSRWANPFPVTAHVGRQEAIELFEVHLLKSPTLLRDLPLLSGADFW